MPDTWGIYPAGEFYLESLFKFRSSVWNVSLCRLLTEGCIQLRPLERSFLQIADKPTVVFGEVELL